MFFQIIECPVRDADGMRRHFFAGVEPADAVVPVEEIGHGHQFPSSTTN